MDNITKELRMCEQTILLDEQLGKWIKETGNVTKEATIERKVAELKEIIKVNKNGDVSIVNDVAKKIKIYIQKYELGYCGFAQLRNGVKTEKNFLHSCSAKPYCKTYIWLINTLRSGKEKAEKAGKIEEKKIYKELLKHSVEICDIIARV